MAFTAALLGGLASSLGVEAGKIGSGLLSSAISYKQASLLQEKQNQWMEYMSNTAHQREVADLRAAGLNPILSAGGSGASTPQAGSAGMSPVDLDPTSAYIAYKQLKREERLSDSQIDLNEKTGEAQSANAFYTKAQGDLANFNYNLQQKYGPLIQEAQLQGIKANTANALSSAAANNSIISKNIQDIVNSKATTAANVRNLDAQTWRAYNQSLGYGTSGSIKFHGSGIDFSHYGNPNAYTVFRNPNNWKTKVEWINGKPYSVPTYGR